MADEFSPLYVFYQMKLTVQDNREAHLTYEDGVPIVRQKKSINVQGPMDLPIWPWTNASCSLDAILSSLLSIAVCLKSKSWNQWTGCGTMVSRQTAFEILRWGQEVNWDWSKSTSDRMTGLRDRVRYMLLDKRFYPPFPPVEINSKTSLDLTLEPMLPPPDLIDSVITLKHCCLCGERLFCPSKRQLACRSGVTLTIRTADERDIERGLTKRVSRPTY
jgi:hypothetical protein